MRSRPWYTRIRMRRTRKKGDIVTVGKALIEMFIGFLLVGALVQYTVHAMMGGCSFFYPALKVFGWKLGNNATAYAVLQPLGIEIDTICTDMTSSDILYQASSGGILTIVGLVAVFTTILRFIRFSIK